MSEASGGPGWWRATDGKWYPPESHPDYRPPPPPPTEPRPMRRLTPPGKQRRGTPLWKLALGVTLGLFLFVGVCSAIISNSVDTGKKVVDPVDSTLSTTPSGPVATPSPSPTTSALKVGDKARLDDGSTVQVYAYVAPVESSNQFSRPKPGNQFVAIDVEGCAGAKAQSVGVFSQSFALAMADNTRITPGIILGKEPSLTSGAQPAGTCNRGWVNYEIAASAKPAAVLYTGFATAVRWVVP